MHIYKMKNTKNVEKKTRIGTGWLANNTLCTRVYGKYTAASGSSYICISIHSTYQIPFSLYTDNEWHWDIKREELTKFIIKLKDILDPDDVIFFFIYERGKIYMVSFIISNRHSHSFHIHNIFYIYIHRGDKKRIKKFFSKTKNPVHSLEKGFNFRHKKNFGQHIIT